ncbi:MAG: ATP-dependent Clp protease proteolytic subunit, partial [Caulobacterales bacterium]
MVRLEDEKPEAQGPTPPQVDKALFEARQLLLTGEINDVQARRVSAALLALAAVSDDPITLILSSPGGHVESGDMIHDMIKFVK